MLAGEGELVGVQEPAVVVVEAEPVPVADGNPAVGLGDEEEIAAGAVTGRTPGERVSGARGGGRPVSLACAGRRRLFRF